MIKAEELRIGNVLELLANDMKFPLPTGRYVNVTEIKKDRIQVNMKLKNNEFGFTFNRRFKTLQPIPLTEEWILKCGFEKINKSSVNAQFTFKGRIIVIRDGNFVDYGSSVILPTIHKLQNFIYALTNEELKIEL